MSIRISDSGLLVLTAIAESLSIGSSQLFLLFDRGVGRDVRFYEEPDVQKHPQNKRERPVQRSALPVSSEVRGKAA